MSNPADPAHPVHDLIATRYSPRAFSDRAVSQEDVRSLLEAARWAPSCFNEQPWRYLLAMKSQPDEFARMLSCLVEFNQSWAKEASVLLLAVASTQFERNQKPNRHAWHDVGAASGSLSLQATALGLQAHQMAGFDADRARAEFAIPEEFEPVAAIAIGYPGSADSLPEDLRERELAARERKPLSELVFSGAWGKGISSS